jgi:hypothetical protein
MSSSSTTISSYYRDRLREPTTTPESLSSQDYYHYKGPPEYPYRSLLQRQPMLTARVSTASR